MPRPRSTTLAHPLLALEPSGRHGVCLRRGRLSLFDLDGDARPVELPEQSGGKLIAHAFVSRACLDDHWIAWIAPLCPTDMPANERQHAPRHLFWVARTVDGIGTTLWSTHIDTEQAEFLEAVGDGCHVCVAGNDWVRLMNLSREHEAPNKGFHLRGRVVHAIATSAKLDLLAVGLFGAVRIIDISAGRTIGECGVDDGNVTHLSFGGTTLAAITENEVTSLFEVDAARPPSSWPERRLAQFACRGDVGLRDGALSSDGRLLATRYKSKDVMVWDLRRGTQQRLRAHRGRVALVRFRPDGRVLQTVDRDGLYLRWSRTDDDRLLGIP